MPLTPEDVSRKTFTPVRLREGYDMAEVDQFLDEVETELRRLGDENADLRSRLENAPAPGAAEPAAPVAPTSAPAVATVPEASGAAARLLEIATTNADQLVSEARTDADRILEEARARAERLEQESRSRAEQAEAEARSRAERLQAETAERREQVFGDLERERAAMAREVEDLRAFEREFRSRLRSYFQTQLQALEADGDPSSRNAAAELADGQAPDPLPDAEPAEQRSPLRELLGDDA